MKKLIFICFMLIFVTGCSSVNSFDIESVTKIINDDGEICEISYFVNDKHDKTNVQQMPCGNIVQGYVSTLKKDKSSSNWFVELTKTDYDNIKISDRRTVSVEKLNELYGLIKDKETTKTHRIVKIETTTWGGYKVYYKGSVRVDAPTLELEFNSWLEGDKNVVVSGEIISGKVNIVFLNQETIQQMSKKD